MATKEQDSRREPAELSVEADGKVPCAYCGKRGSIKYFTRHKCYRRTWFCPVHRAFSTMFTARVA